MLYSLDDGTNDLKPRLLGGTITGGRGHAIGQTAIKGVAGNNNIAIANEIRY